MVIHHIAKRLIASPSCRIACLVSKKQTRYPMQNRLISTTSLSRKQYENDEPVRFTGSRADRNSMDTFAAPITDAPRYQYPIVWLSIVAFLLYFCVFREENDIDDYLRDNVIVDPVKEVSQLEQKLEKEKAAGLNTKKTEMQLEKVRMLMDGDRQVLDRHLLKMAEAKTANKSVIGFQESFKK